MANNVTVLDSAGASKTFKTTDNASVHTPHQNVDALPADPMGANADAAVVSDVSGSISAKLRGLVKMLADVWDSTNHVLKISVDADTRVSANFTRPNDTTAYTAGDVVANSTSAPVVMTFSNVVAANGKGGLIVNAKLLSSANQTTKGEFELWLFHTAPAAQNDNAACAFSDAEMANVAAVIQFPSGYAFVGNAGAGAAGNVLYQPDQVNKKFKCGASDTSLYGVLVVRNAYTPVALEVFTVTLEIV
jgi:hypothetical protein